MKWVIRQAETEDVLEGFSKTDGRPRWNPDDRKAKWFSTWNEVSVAVDIVRKCGDDCYPEVLEKRR